ncbi:Peptidase M8 [Trypanosoma melophagium]|uniref:Peptidase M8 n=1 Tax=Trypanosoma melophagium TaxID=715481 RepID=UPI003519D930|nr:Peptidase M8 [Trypanosoma melophagium]
MRRLFCVVLVLLCFTRVGIASYAGFTWEWPKKTQDLQRTFIPYLGQSEGLVDKDSVEWKPIRIAVNAWGVLNAIQTCDNLKNGGSQYVRFFEKVNPVFDRGICEAVESVTDGNTLSLEIKDGKIRESLQKFWNCSDDRVGVIKMERVGNGKNQFHFPKSFVTGELMNPHNGGMVYSPLSLAVLESTGHFKAEFDKAEGPAKWKRGQKGMCGKLQGRR